MDYDRIGAGWTLHDSNNEKIGEVTEVGTNYLLVQKGLIFVKDLYIPMSALSEVDQAGRSAYLNVSKSEVDAMGWDQPPADDLATGGYTETTETSERASAEATGGGYAASARASTGDADRQRLTLHEEQLQAETHQETAGEIEVRKRVVEDTQEIEVPVMREEVDVRRVRVDRPDAGNEAAFTDDGETIRVPVSAERVEVSKSPRVVEEIEIDTRQVTDRARVRDTVRREEAEIEQEGDVVMSEGSRELVGSGSDRFQRTSIDDIEDLGEQERRERGL